jgi:hypothetical protein
MAWGRAMITLTIGSGAATTGVNRILPVEGRTRGPIAPLAVDTAADRMGVPISLPFAELLDALRQQISYMPLSLIIHGWGGREAEYFFERILPALSGDDAVWLVPLEEGDSGEDEEPLPIAPSEFTAAHTTLTEGAVILRPDDPADFSSDKRIYANLFGDLVFFPAAECREESLAARFARRARAVLVHGAGAFREAVSQAAETAGLFVYAWPGEPKAIAAAQPGAASDLALQGEAPDNALTDEVGEALTEMAAYLQNEFMRRRYFRAEIVKKIGEYPEYAKWDEALIRQAHKRGWEEWAVDCLPALYVPLSSAGEVSTALAWHYVVECVPEKHSPKILEDLCGGMFKLVEANEDAVAYMRTGAGIFEEQLKTFPYSSERSYKYGAVNNALLYIELALVSEDEKAARRVKRLRQELLSQDRIVS